MSKESEWRTHIEEWKQSGLSQSEWCRSKGFNPGRLSYWRQKLGYTKQPNINFTEISHKPAVTSAKESKLVISIGNARIEITEDINLEFLQKVLKAVTAC